MSFIRNPFRKSVPTKAQQRSTTPTSNRANNTTNARTATQGAKTGTGKKSLPSNYLDPNSMF